MRRASCFHFCSWPRCSPPAASAAAAGSRIKDIAMIAGARDNQLSGFGLVTGLAGDGDKNPVDTIQTIANLLQRYGLTVPASTLSAKNVAVVMVTADIPAFAKPGSRLDVVVSSMGDAKSLQGGVLIQTPLLGADGKVYAVAQGTLSIGGLSAGGGRRRRGDRAEEPSHGRHDHQRRAGGAGNPRHHRQRPPLGIGAARPGFHFRRPHGGGRQRKFPDSSIALDATTVRVRMPADWAGSPMDFIAQLETLEVTPDVPARIVINERTGTIVATARIHISSCAVAHGNVTISIASTQDVSQPTAFSQGGTTAVTSRTDAKIKEDKGALVALPELPTVEKVAAALNALGVTPRDMMSMFEAMKEAGALQAELILR